MVVTYDAAGVRRQAGIHAQRINVIFGELLRGHTVDQKELREVLGHTPLEVTGGVFWDPGGNCGWSGRYDVSRLDRFTILSGLRTWAQSRSECWKRRSETA